MCKLFRIYPGISPEEGSSIQTLGVRDSMIHETWNRPIVCVRLLLYLAGPVKVGGGRSSLEGVRSRIEMNGHLVVQSMMNTPGGQKSAPNSG